MKSTPILHTFLWFLCFAFLPVSAKQVQWKMKEYRGNKYVPLSQVKEFYNLTSMTQSGRQIILKNDQLNLKFQAGGQEVLMNDVKFIFSNAIVALGTYHMSVTDLLKVIDPVLRPANIDNAKAFDTVIIDPGHGGRDAGAVNSLGTEAGYNLKVALLPIDRKMPFSSAFTLTLLVLGEHEELKLLRFLPKEWLITDAPSNNLTSLRNPETIKIPQISRSPQPSTGAVYNDSMTLS